VFLPYRRFKANERGKYILSKLDKHFRYLLLIPGAVWIFSFIIFPLGYSLYLSFTSYNLLRLGSKVFIGLKNYQELIHDPTFYFVLKNTVIFLFVVVNIEFLLGLCIALLLNRTFKGQGIIRALFMIPMMFAPVVVGLQFRWFFNDQFGLLNGILCLIGVLKYPIGWLVESRYAMPSVMIAEIWQNTPFMALILLAGLQSLPREPFEAARVDGASSWQIFRDISLPLLKPIILIAFCIRSLDVVRVFDVVEIMTYGGPGYRTELLGTYIYRLAIRNAKFGLGCAYSYLTIIVTLAILSLLFVQLRKEYRRR